MGGAAIQPDVDLTSNPPVSSCLRIVRPPVVLPAVKDPYTCEIVGRAFSERMAKEFVGRALMRAVVAKRPAAGLIHHSDRGSQH